jgi:hypothetical protein
VTPDESEAPGEAAQTDRTSDADRLTAAGRRPDVPAVRPQPRDNATRQDRDPVDTPLAASPAAVLPTPADQAVLSYLEGIRSALNRIARRLAPLARLADSLAPPPREIVGTPYVAHRLGQTTTWIADLARQGRIPAKCVVPGTGNGKPWKFYRQRIDDWLEAR